MLPGVFFGVRIPFIDSFIAICAIGFSRIVFQFALTLSVRWNAAAMRNGRRRQAE
jgi:hypothetical protein